jgi:hypothetical protein
MSEYLIANDISKNYIIVKDIYITDNKINLLCSYGMSETYITDISFQTIYDVSNTILSVKILPIIGNTDNLSIRQDVIDFSHKIVLLLSGSIKNGLWNKTNDMLSRYTSLDYTEYIPKNNLLLYNETRDCFCSCDISCQDHTFFNHKHHNREYCHEHKKEYYRQCNIECVSEIQSYDKNSIKTQLDNEMSCVAELDKLIDMNTCYSVKTEFINQPPPGINQLFNYILY